jgi:hypothetical protein
VVRELQPVWAGRSTVTYGRGPESGKPNGPPLGRRWGETAGRQPGVSLEVATDNQATILEPKNFSWRD